MTLPLSTQAYHQNVIYLDYQSTTPCDPRVVDKMIPFFTQHYGNPHSRDHIYGWEADKAVEAARAQVAELIGADAKEIILTSGATEANNMALEGLARFYGAKKKHIITVVTEHKCVLDTCRYLEQDGFTVTYLPVQKNGILDLEDLKAALTEQTLVVSIMAVNNEIGVIQPIREIGQICRNHDVFFHTDAAQAAGKIELDVNAMNIDLMSLSSHKMYGPKGVGALYPRRRPRVRLTPMITGGGQERGLRSGTLAPALVVGFGEACAIARQEMHQESEHLWELNRYFYDQITQSLEQVYLNGDLKQRIPGNLNISFSCVEGEGLMGAVNNLAISSGSACTSDSLEQSYVLRAIGVDEDLAHTSLRIGFGRFTTFEQVKEAARSIIHAVKKLRDISSLWEMVQEGIDLKTVKWNTH